MRDAVREEEGGREVVRRTRLSRVRAQLKRVHPLGLAQCIERPHVVPKVEGVVAVRRVVLAVVLARRGQALEEVNVFLCLVVHRVEASDLR